MTFLKLAEKKYALDFVENYCKLLDNKVFPRENLENSATKTIRMLLSKDEVFGKVLLDTISKKYPESDFKTKVRQPA